MKKIIIFALAALMSLSMLSCDVDSPRPNTGTIKVVLADIPEGIGVEAVSIWCTANEWKADNINGSTQYIADVIDGKATFELNDYVLSVPLQFQFTPMPSRDTKMGDDWWSYAISGSSEYSKNKNNITCDIIAKNGHDGSTITVNKSRYGVDHWNTAFPIYGVSPTRWFNNDNYSSCFDID